MKYALILGSTLLASAFSLSAQADTPITPTLSAHDALSTAQALQPANYSRIELLPGLNEREVYLIDGEKTNLPVTIVLDAQTGNPISDAKTLPEATLAEAVLTVSERFEGVILEAEYLFEPGFEQVYSVIVEQTDTVVQILLHPDSLKVLAVDTLEDIESLEDSELSTLHSNAYHDIHQG